MLHFFQHVQEAIEILLILMQTAITTKTNTLNAKIADLDASQGQSTNPKPGERSDSLLNKKII